MNYIRKNAQSWHDYLRELRRSYSDEQLIIVTSWTKVDYWHLAAFHRRESDSSSGPFFGKVIATEMQPLSFTFENCDSMVIRERFGPPPDQIPLPGEPILQDLDSPGNQCLFLRGFRTRKRTLLPGFKLYATAGASNPTPGPDHPRVSAVRSGFRLQRYSGQEVDDQQVADLDLEVSISTYLKFVMLSRVKQCYHTLRYRLDPAGVRATFEVRGVITPMSP